LANNINHSLRQNPISKLTGLWKHYGKSFQKISLILVKWSVMVLSARYLYFHVIKNTHFDDIYNLSISILTNPTSIWILAVCLLLVFINWGLETMKWRFLIKSFASISFLRSFAAIMSGNAVSLLTPNRVGEYVGRVFFLDSEVRIKSIFATLLGSVSQMIVTLILGVLGFVYFEKSIDAPFYIQLGIGIGGLIFISLLLFFFFNIRVIRSWLPAKRWSKSIRKYLMVYKLYKNKELETVLLYSLCRYLVFAFQFYLLLVFFGIQIPLIQAMFLIFLMYAVQTVSPTNGFTELIVRGGTTAFLFKGFTPNLAGVLAASYSIWMINLMIPALFGAVIFGFARINKRRQAA